MLIKTERLVITELARDMAKAMSDNSKDDDNRRFVPDEVFETEEIALSVIEDLIECYATDDGPFVYAVLENGKNIGYVQLVAITEGWEIGYHIAKPKTGRGYATEALRAFLEPIMTEHGLDSVWGICLADNTASMRVLEKCGFVRKYLGEGTYQGEKRRIAKYTYAKK